jgi:hypothetical protein
MNDQKLHRQTKQQDSEALAVSLQTCCAFTNSALVEDGVCCGSNEFYFRVAEHYCQIDEPQPIDLETTARVLEKLAEQFRTFAENAREADHTEDDDDERQDATKA